MRSAIIVTVTDAAGSFNYDVEVPMDVPADKVAGDIAEVLNYYKGTPILPHQEYRLQNKRTGKLLDSEATFLESGVWQGDILIIK